MLDRPTHNPISSALRNDIPARLRRIPSIYVLLALAGASWAIVGLCVIAVSGISRAFTGL